mmetsp:Transcript_100850/g.284486  ORF Transcript_100850/g.284486 Transcript_100850/m.284486 type:complete len:349 (+) Transcript_100850:1318-2364(+)
MVAVATNEDLHLGIPSIAVVLVPHDHALPIGGVEECCVRRIVRGAPRVRSELLHLADPVALQGIWHGHPHGREVLVVGHTQYLGRNAIENKTQLRVPNWLAHAERRVQAVDQHTLPRFCRVDRNNKCIERRFPWGPQIGCLELDRWRMDDGIFPRSNCSAGVAGRNNSASSIADNALYRHTSTGCTFVADLDGGPQLGICYLTLLVDFAGHDGRGVNAPRRNVHRLCDRQPDVAVDPTAVVPPAVECARVNFHRQHVRTSPTQWRPAVHGKMEGRIARWVAAEENAVQPYLAPNHYAVELQPNAWSLRRTPSRNEKSPPVPRLRIREVAMRHVCSAGEGSLDDEVVRH